MMAPNANSIGWLRKTRACMRKAASMSSLVHPAFRRCFRSAAAMPRKGKAQNKDIASPSVPSGPVASDKSGSVTIAVHAKPGSKQNAVTDLSTEAVGIAIAAPPSDGEANAELCRYLSKVLEVKKSEVVLEKGGRSREKLVKILAPLTPEEVLQKLRKEVAG